MTAAVAALLGGAVQAEAATTVAPGSHPAAAGDRWTVVGAPSAVSFRNSPNWNDVGDVGGFVNGQIVELSCYEFGGPAGPYSNTLWYAAYDETTDAVGWINDHYLNTPGTATAPQPQTGICNDTSGYGVGDDNYSGAVFSAVDAAGTVAWRNFPNWDHASSIGFATGDAIDLGCYTFGGVAGPYRNTLWYHAYDRSRNSYGWINDHNLNTPGTAATPRPQTWECDPAYYLP
ncbi:hypothetical protein [Amycolatopsis sp. NPDC004378]